MGTPDVGVPIRLAAWGSPQSGMRHRLRLTPFLPRGAPRHGSEVRGLGEQNGLLLFVGGECGRLQQFGFGLAGSPEFGGQLSPDAGEQVGAADGALGNRAVHNLQGGGRTPDPGHCVNASTRASWARSSARPTSPVTLASVAMIRALSIRHTAIQRALDRRPGQVLVSFLAGGGQSRIR